MTQRIAKGSSARSKPRSGARVQTRRRPEPKVLDALPLPPEAMRRASWWMLAALLLASAVGVAAALKLPQTAGLALGEQIGKAGFQVRRVEVKGAERLNPLQAQLIALDQISMAMPLVDLEGTRQRLLRLGWIEDARVFRRLPDTLVVDIVERRPAALWQHKGQLALIDSQGVVLEPVRLDAMPDLPLVVGPAANRHAAQLERLLAQAPELKAMMAAASWIGGRRWDIRFQSGEVLALPEGEAAAAKALGDFARIDRTARLLGRGLVRFDMRVPGKIIVRVSRDPGGRVPSLAPEAQRSPQAPAPPAPPATPAPGPTTI